MLIPSAGSLPKTVKNLQPVFTIDFIFDKMNYMHKQLFHLIQDSAVILRIYLL